MSAQAQWSVMDGQVKSPGKQVGADGRRHRVLLADDDSLRRHALRALLGRQADMELVAETDTVQALATVAAELEADVVILSMTMRHCDGVTATRRLVARLPGVRVLAVSLEHAPHCIAATIAAGAKGYVVANCDLTELVAAARIIAAGGIYLCRRAARAAATIGSAAPKRAVSSPDRPTSDEIADACADCVYRSWRVCAEAVARYELSERFSRI